MTTATTVAMRTMTTITTTRKMITAYRVFRPACRRFHRPSFGIDYYDPFYVDLYHYDPFFFSGVLPSNVEKRTTTTMVPGVAGAAGIPGIPGTPTIRGVEAGALTPGDGTVAIPDTTRGTIRGQ
jgi:hypothetical protein